MSNETPLSTSPNAVVLLAIQRLSSVLPPELAERSVQAALKRSGLDASAMTAQAMQSVVAGPLRAELSGQLAPDELSAALGTLEERLQTQGERAAPPVAQLAESDFEWDDDDFEFDDPEELLRTSIAQRDYNLSQPASQEALLLDLARLRGVQGVVLCDRQGKVLRAKLSHGAAQLGGVVAATALLLGARRWRVLSAELGEQTVCVRPLGDCFVALLASGGTNLGRLIAELGSLRVSA